MAGEQGQQLNEEELSSYLEHIYLRTNSAEDDKLTKEQILHYYRHDIM